MTRTKSLPWSSWDATLERMGEWLLVGSIAAIGLPAIPGIISLIAILIFFSLRNNSQVHPEIERFVQLKKKAKESSLTKEEEIESSEYGYDLIINPPKRNLRCYNLGAIFWILSMLYLFLWTGWSCQNWLPS